jgi:hypothetical protein
MTQALYARMNNKRKKKVHKNQYLNGKKLGVVLHTCHLSYGGSIKVRPFLKNNQKKRAGGMAQVVERLPRKWEAMSSNPS